MFTGQLKGISDNEYQNIFFLLKQNDRGNVTYDVLIEYLTSVYDLSAVAVLGILLAFGDKNKNDLNVYQFVNMMKELNGINESVAEKCKSLFKMCDINEDGYIETNDLIGSYTLNLLSKTKEDALETMRKLGINEDEKLNFIEFAHFYNNQ